MVNWVHLILIVLHPTLQESKRAWVIPSKVENLYKCWWRDGKLNADHYPTMDEVRQTVQDNLRTLRQDHKRSLNPTPYKVGCVGSRTAAICVEAPSTRGVLNTFYLLDTPSHKNSTYKCHRLYLWVVRSHCGHHIWKFLLRS